MAAITLEQVGPPEIGESFKRNKQVAAGGAAVTVAANRIIQRVFKLPLSQREAYTFALINPTQYDDIYTQAVIVDQAVQKIAGNKAESHLLLTFAEVPTAWDEYIYDVAPFPGVALSSLFAPAEFAFRNGPITLKTTIRRNRAYGLGRNSLAEYQKFQPVDADGVLVSTIDDNTTPSADEYIASVVGRQEIVINCDVRVWMGDIYCRTTDFAQAK